ncbi:hypothetical protein ACWEVY_28530 [Streptomyces longwoodensis]
MTLETLSVERRIRALVVNWLAEKHGIEAVSAEIDEADWEIKTRSNGGCDTCAYEENYLELTIWYAREGEYGHPHYIEVEKDPLSFLAELLRLEDENK